MDVAFCTGWQLKKDGIADYSAHLVKAFRSDLNATIIELGYYINEKEYYIQQAVKANKSDIAHIQFNYVYFNGTLPYRNRLLVFLRHLKVPVVMTMHEVHVGFEAIASRDINIFKRMLFNLTLFFWNAWSKRMHQKALKRVDKIIVHTDAQARTVEKLIGNASEIMVIPHGIPEVSDEDRGFDSKKAKSSLGLEDKFVLTIFGFINKKKGYELALKALLGLPEDMVLLIAGGLMTDNAGDKEYYAGLLRLIEEKGLSKRVKVLGYVKNEDTALIMAATDICLAPFISGSASGALSLCLAYAKPIVASNISVNSEIQGRIPCLELFSSNDPEDLRQAIERLFSDEKKRQDLTVKAAQYSRKFSYRMIAQETEEAYRSLVGGSPYQAEAYWEKRLRERFSLSGTGHAGFTERYNRYMYKRKLRVLSGALAQRAIAFEDKKVLDVGCGTGFFVDFYLRNKVASVTGLDITEVSVRTLKEKFPGERFYQQDISDDNNSIQETFDIINCFDVLYHITDESKFLKALKNIGAWSHPGTWIFISDAGKPSLSHSEHVKYRPFDLYKEAFKAQGIEVVGEYPIFNWLGKTPLALLRNNFIQRISARCVEALVPLAYLFDSWYCPSQNATMTLLACRKK